MKKIFAICISSVILLTGFGQVVVDTAGYDPILVDVEVKPTWKGCDQKNDSLRKLCFENRLNGFFDDFIIYPEMAKKKKVEGQVLVQFVVEKDGSISNIQIIHDIGEGCGDEVVRAIKHLPKLIPGMDKGAAVRVVYRAPFNFVLK